MGSDGGVILIKLSDAEERLGKIVSLFISKHYNLPGEKREKWSYNKKDFLYEKTGLIGWKEDLGVSSRSEIQLRSITEIYSPNINIWEKPAIFKCPLLVLSYGDNIYCDFLDDLTDLLYDKIIIRQKTWT
jgi:hypothetical protein